MPKTKNKLKIYLDTSVISVYDDSRIPHRQVQTREFWKNLKNCDVYVSQVTLNKISDTPNNAKRQKLLNLTKGFSLLQITDEVKKLSQQYLAQKVIPEKYGDDALHLAAATVNKLDVLVSWNCKHLVNLKTKIKANQINLSLGYDQIKLSFTHILPH